ncbi:Uncharacterised protein [Klebsiella pneumoniae]|uniref:Uncharacterized protein n=4 Tax=Klebsiella pneumoniae complex TaxID=3390273 RepID=A0A378P2I5_KLEPN|nr:Uncharacterised protein [Klebsiella pneumoniae]STY78786.1 Uncharacterised protein [Klebsiella pneumoniae]
MPGICIYLTYLYFFLFYRRSENIIFGRICARQLLTVQSMYAEPFMEIFAQVFRLFPFNKFRHDGLVHALLPGNSSSHLIDGNFILLLL